MSRRVAFLAVVALAACNAGGPQKAEEAEAKGDLDQAAFIYADHARRNPNDAAAREKARAAADKAAAARFAKVDALVKTGDLDAAEREAEAAIYFAPGNGDYRAKFSDIRVLRRSSKEKIRLAGAAIRAEDWVKARRLLEPIRPYAPSFPEIGRLWSRVAEESYALAMREGDRFLKLLDYEASATWFKDAEGLFPDREAARKKRKTAEDRARARTLAREAAARIAEKKFMDAVAKAREAAALHKESKQVEAVLRESLRTAALDALDRSKKAEDGGDLRAAYAAAKAAAGLKVPQPGLRGKVTHRHDVLAKRVAAKYLAAGIDLEKKGLEGAAWLCYRVARQVRPNFKGLDDRLRAVRGRMDSRKIYRMVVIPPETAGKRVAPGGAAIFAEGVRKELAEACAGHMKVYRPADLDGTKLRETGRVPDGVVRGKLQELWLESKPPKVTKRSVRYVAGEVPELNMRIEQLQQDLERVQQDAAAAQQKVGPARQKFERTKRDLDAARARRDRVASRPAPTIDDMFRRQNAVMQEDRKVQQANQAHTFAMLEMQLAESAVRDAENAAERTREELLTEPPYVMRPMYRNYAYEVVEASVSGLGTCVFEAKDFATGGEIKELRVEKTRRFTDTVVAGFPAAKIKADPAELPSDRDMLLMTSRRTAAGLIEELKDGVASHGTRFVRLAERARKAGDVDREMHYLGLAWNLRERVVSRELKDVVERIESLTGWNPEKGGFDPARMPAGPLR